MSKGFGFIEFEKKESALSVLNSNESIFISGRKIFIQEFKK